MTLAQPDTLKKMDDTSEIYNEIASLENLKLAEKKARKRKTLKPYVREFESNLKEQLKALHTELLLHSYQPRPLETFSIREPRTRKISKSHFRDRVVHHAICNVIEPIYEKKFIYDSCANRKGKGTLFALKRFETFRRKVTQNFTKVKGKVKGFVLKADIRHYFDTVDHKILLGILKRTIKDNRALWLIRKIIGNHETKVKGKGMPLGNLTSQFFANVYLNELDQYVKHKLKARYYIRYVDDFVILHKSSIMLGDYKKRINSFLKDNLELELHPEKSRIFPLHRGTPFLGFRLYPYHRAMQKRNIRTFKNKFKTLCSKYDSGKAGYDKVYDFMEGWCAYAKTANTYKLRRKLLKTVEDKFDNEVSTKEINRALKEQREFEKAYHTAY